MRMVSTLDLAGWVAGGGPVLFLVSIVVLFSTALGRLAIWISESDAEIPAAPGLRRSSMDQRSL